MIRFMNAELKGIRDNLTCGHCAARFEGSDSQARKVRYEKQTVYCSCACRQAAVRNKLSTPVPNRGACKTCGIQFFSRKAKEYCSMDCYTRSAQFKSMLADNRQKSRRPESRERIARALRRGIDVPCLDCGMDFYQKRATNGSPLRKYCSTSCYRSYLAKRFDRWVANPEGMALPQCYDEFLDQTELGCIIEGCTWHGQALTLHVNQAHGVQARDFKRAAGFNLGSGIIARPLAQALSQRERIGVGLNTDGSELRVAAAALAHAQSMDYRYRSLEGREHAKKGRALADAGPQRHCKGCGKSFQQSTPFGRALYCSTTCRGIHYADMGRAKAKKRCRQRDGTFKWEQIAI